MVDESSRDTRFATALHGDVAGYSNLPYRNKDKLARFIAELEAAGLE